MLRLFPLFLQPNTSEPPARSKSGKLIGYWPPRSLPYISYNAPPISSVMQGPKTNLAPYNLLLSTLKRKTVTNKVLNCRMKKKIDTKVVNISDMDEVLANALQY
jgi:hypothetical protein